MKGGVCEFCSIMESIYSYGTIGYAAKRCNIYKSWFWQSRRTEKIVQLSLSGSQLKSKPATPSVSTPRSGLAAFLSSLGQ
uniref:Uncharacterized protein n=1 Tax=Romanomermis culicivorax TaxID=13658 RepID=A0A915JSZ7_ROMCU